jgi:hypothetical protein
MRELQFGSFRRENPAQSGFTYLAPNPPTTQIIPEAADRVLTDRVPLRHLGEVDRDTIALQGSQLVHHFLQKVDGGGDEGTIEPHPAVRVVARQAYMQLLPRNEGCHMSGVPGRST